MGLHRANNAAPRVRQAFVTLAICFLLSGLAGLEAVNASTIEDARTQIRQRAYGEAAKIFESLAITGDLKAQYGLASLLRSGKGVPKDLKKDSAILSAPIFVAL